MLICEMAAYYYSKEMSLYDGLLNLYDEYGYFLEDLKSITLEGIDGLEKIGKIMSYFKTNKLEIIENKKVVSIEDYETQEKLYLDKSQEREKINLPKANVVKFILEDNAWVCLRPSGTEPKLKIYAGVKANTLQKSKEELGNLIKWMEQRIQQII